MEEIKQYLEEMAAFHRSCSLTFKSDLGAVISLQVKILKYYVEDGEEFVLIESGNRIRIKDIIDVDNLRSNTIS